MRTSVGDVSKSSRASSSTINDSEHPGISNAVMKLPHHPSTGSAPSSRSLVKARRATMASSIGGVPPRPLTSTPRRHPFTDNAWLRDSSMLSTMVSAGSMADLRTPFSPWMPKPNSISSSPSSNPGRPTAGTVQAPKEIPMVATDSAAPRASAATSSRGRPRATAAPAILCTSTVPATPRLCSRGSESRSATSSATITTSTGIPRTLASSAARRKLRRSPV